MNAPTRTAGRWRVVRVPAATATGISPNRSSCWAALPPAGSKGRARTFPAKPRAERWAKGRALREEALDVWRRLDRKSGEMLAAMPAGLTARDAFGLSLQIFRAADLIARLVGHLEAGAE